MRLPGPGSAPWAMADRMARRRAAAAAAQRIHQVAAAVLSPPPAAGRHRARRAHAVILEKRDLSRRGEGNLLLALPKRLPLPPTGRRCERAHLGTARPAARSCAGAR